MAHQRESKETKSALEASPEQDAFMERIRLATETNGSGLHHLYEKEGQDSEAFRDRLEDIVANIAFTDKTYAENARLLREGTLGKEELARIAAQQREKADMIRHLVVIQAGLPTAELESDIEKGRRAVLDRLDDADLLKLESNDILRKLGILTEDKDGIHFTYPEDLFPESVNEKWRTYMATVKDHERLAQEMGAGYASSQDLEYMNGVRSFAHNRLTNDVHTILGFDSLPENMWDFKATRDLIGKMRDSKYIGKDMRESEVTSRALARGLGSDALRLSIVEKLAERTQPKR